MQVLSLLFEELLTVLTTFVIAIPYIAGYVGIILATLFMWRLVKRSLQPRA